MSDDQLDVIVADAFAQLEDASPRTLAAFAHGLKLAGGAVGRFSLPILYLSNDREYGEPASAITMAAMRVALMLAATDDQRLLARLADAQGFWGRVGDGLALVQERRLAV